MSNISILTGDYQVYYSGVVVCLKDKDTIFKFDGLEFVFKYLNSEDNIPKMETKLISSDKMEIIFYNFNKPFGVGSKNPIEIGTIREKKLYLSYKVDFIGKDAGSTFFYTWLIR